MGAVLRAHSVRGELRIQRRPDPELVTITWEDILYVRLSVLRNRSVL